MPSLVDELQMEASNPAISISNLLRKAWMVASKLGLSDVPAWIKNELEGYKVESDIPGYRVLHGTLKAQTYQGWLPARLPTTGLEDTITKRSLDMPISELEAILQKSGSVTFSFTPEQQKLLGQFFVRDTEYRLFVEQASLNTILEAARNKVLEWAIALEQSGVKGEGLTFSEAEKKNALGATFNFHGGNHHFGSVGQSGGSTQQALGENARTYIQSTDNSYNAAWQLKQNQQTAADEFENLCLALRREAENPAQFSALGAIANAQLAFKDADPAKASVALSTLGAAGEWALGVAEKIGVPLAVAAIKAHVGMPPT